jgi:hypothetical protein
MCDIATSATTPPCVAESAPDNGCSLYRIAHVAEKPWLGILEFQRNSQTRISMPDTPTAETAVTIAQIMSLIIVPFYPRYRRPTVQNCTEREFNGAILDRRTYRRPTRITRRALLRVGPVQQTMPRPGVSRGTVAGRGEPANLRWGARGYTGAPTIFGRRRVANQQIVGVALRRTQ